MKPRLFIGSSKEAIDIAHAAQQNLQSHAEVTVWDQGVFPLSLTTLESLSDMVKTCDFGMFVFSPDDIVTIRGKENSAVRDNVIFELGMFMGVLGRERCFVLVPDSAKDLRIPTDLFGITLADFETNRSDGSMQAATAPACRMIRERIASLKIRSNRSQPVTNAGGEIPDNPVKSIDSTALETTPNDEELKSGDRSDKSAWVGAFLKRDYTHAAEQLEQLMTKSAEDDERIEAESWLGFVKCYIDPISGIQHLTQLIAKGRCNWRTYHILAAQYLSRERNLDALELLQRAIDEFGNELELIILKFKCLAQMGRNAEAEETIFLGIKHRPEASELYVLLAEHLLKTGNKERARAVLEDADPLASEDEVLLAKYAEILADTPDKKLALLPYRKLIRMRPEDPTYLTRRGNIFLELELNDMAMNDYKRASELAEHKQGWILANIGNLLKNRGFYREGIEYFKRALTVESESDYAHERLATAIKSRDEEEKKVEDLLAQARIELNEAKARKLKSEAVVPPAEPTLG